MKTFIFLITGGLFLLKYYEIPEIKKLASMQIIFIIKKNLEKSIPKEILDNIDRIYSVDTEEEDFYLSPLLYDPTAKIVGNECRLSNDVLLITFNEANVLLAAKLRDEFNLPGDGFSVSNNFVNKISMKQCLMKHAIRVPKFMNISSHFQELEHKEQFLTLEKIIGLPFIVKPASLAGGIGVEKIKSLKDYLKWIDIKNPALEYEAEEFIDGRLFHCDLIIKQKRILWAGCAEYNLPLLAISENKCVGSIPIPPNFTLNEQLISFAKNAHRSLGQTSGICHLELFITSAGEIIFLEAAARPGGAYIIPMYHKTYGVNILSAYLKSLFLSEPIIVSNNYEYAAWLAMPRKTGTITELCNPEIASQYEINWQIEIGKYYQASQNMLDSAGLIFLWNTSYDQLRKDFFNLTSFSPYVC